ncbi:MAG: PHP domain-containing protein [Clostridiales bacterium]|nr:PHP domain-containing protein [Clostridiales bacterium]
MKYIDLHVHTNASDGTCTPSEVVEKALQIGLSAIAITDHDTVSGIKEAKQYLKSINKESDLTIIPGVEISADYHGRDIHILGLYINESDKGLNTKLAKAIADREARNEKMAENLRKDGIDIHVSDLTFGEPNTVITRAHFARFLTEHGYVKNNTDAFTKYLGSDTKYYVPRSYMTPKDAIDIILAAGGVPVLAHPLLYKLDLAGIEELVSYVKSLGMAGIETIYSSNTGFDEGIVRRFANKYDLLMTGGSDFHGSNKPQISMGTGRGNLKIPETLLEPIKRGCEKL